VATFSLFWNIGGTSSPRTQEILNGTAPMNATIIQDFAYAIGTHNFDDGFCLWNATSNTLYTTMCTFQTSGNPYNATSKTTPLLNRTEPYTRGYTFGHCKYAPLGFAVRVADNLDAVRTRLTPVQNNPQLMNFFLRVYVDADLRNAVAANPNGDLDTPRVVARARATTYAGITNASQAQSDVMNMATEQSWLHFYSNWIIEDAIIDSATWSIDVSLWNISAPLAFSSHPGPGLYQVNRLASSALSCLVDNTTSFLELVRFNFNLPINGVDNANYLPLKAFTKKPVYDQMGPVRWPGGTIHLICDPYCDELTNDLTLSPEPCLDMNNMITNNCNIQGFSLVPPFTDLSYIPSAEASSSPVDHTVIIVVVVCVVIGVLVVVIAIAVVIFYRRKHSGYEPIQSKA